MGICYSSTSAKKISDRKKRVEKIVKNNSPVDFATFISKLSGGGAAAAAAVVAEDGILYQVPGRIFSNGSTSLVSLYTQQGKKGTNQDAMIFWENFCTGTQENATFCGVFDGHGPNGHMVAKKVRDALPILLRLLLETPVSVNRKVCDENGTIEEMKRFDDLMEDEGDDGCGSVDLEGIEKFPYIHIQLKNTMLKAFKLLDRELKLQCAIDCFCSGSTAVTLIKQGQDLIIGNIGDSRAVLATRDDNNALVAVQLTVDLKPNLPREAARIRKCKGRVFALRDEPDVARVWLPNSDAPGLAMARAFGDFCLKDFGLISIPDVYYRRISERDEFVVLATDGVWDVLSSQEAIDIVASAPSRGTASRALVDCATRAWRLKYPTSKTDDCAAVCLFLDQPTKSDAPKPQNHVENVTISSETVSKSQIIESKELTEIFPIIEEHGAVGQSKRSLSEFISTPEENEWSALEGITRVNSLLSIPRLPTFNKKSSSSRKRL